MNYLKDILRFEFDGYDTESVKMTKENIIELTKDTDVVWDMWKESGMNENDKFKVDFRFYSAYEEGVQSFSAIMRSHDVEVVVNPKRLLLIFKGYEVKLTLNEHWTLAKLNEVIELIGLYARKHNVLIEGYGAHVGAEN